MGVDHYENFPVASIVLPARLRGPVATIYRVAREADDLADEGDATAEARLDALRERLRRLDAIAAGDTPPQPNWRALAQLHQATGVPLDPIRDLIDAFMQDVTVTRYATDADVLDYCRRSANPVGRLLLHLFGRTDATALAQSDAICTALQRINFLQDVAIDAAKGRIYLPLDALARFQVDPADLAAGRVTPQWRALMHAQIAQERARMQFGAPLGRALGGRIGLELRLVVAGGLRVLDRIAAVDGDVFRRRPVLGATDWLRVGARALVA
ncbi:MAG: squalene synthase HpnC [Burkholderiales bacterium]|nr:squalene synthase HpnC [Burkholderiales bacterium]